MNRFAMSPEDRTPTLRRRDFLRRSALAAGWMVAPAAVLGRGGEATPNSRLNIACIGVGGRGRDDLNEVKGENIVALCDVDQERAGASFKAFPGAKVYGDFRKMFDELGNSLDAVVVATPDHTHAPAAMAALQLRKHVYCEKPLAHSLREVRTLTETARKQKVMTQLGNQGHAWESTRQFCELVWDGAIGVVREVHAWSVRGYQPRFRVRPTDTPPVPASLDWDLWLGPAPARPYHPAYVPGKWRGWVDFGTGILGDWTCHVVDPVFWALELGSPSSVQAQAEDYDDPQVRAETFPARSQITYRFPARGKRQPITLKWFIGSAAPRPEELEEKRKMPDIGAVVIGDKGKIMYGSHGAGGAQLLPVEKDKAYRRPAPKLPRSKGHHEEWIAACKGGPAAGSNFDYGGPLTEIALLGVLAERMNGQLLEWDAQALKVTNLAEASRWIDPPYRQGWKL